MLCFVGTVSGSGAVTRIRLPPAGSDGPSGGLARQPRDGTH